MKEVCGFKDKNGYFHDSKKACENADLDIEIREVERYLTNFSSEIETYMWQSYTRDNHKKIIFFQREVLNLVSKIILRDSDKFIEIINQKKELKNTLDKLKAKRKGSFQYWWLKTKWW